MNKLHVTPNMVMELGRIFSEKSFEMEQILNELSGKVEEFERVSDGCMGTMFMEYKEQTSHIYEYIKCIENYGKTLKDMGMSVLVPDEPLINCFEAFKE